MIDTEKYKGHTPAPWKTNPNDLGTWIDGSSNEEIATVHNYAPANRVNCELIADAPLLLAEVKRLREATLKAREVLMKHYDWMSLSDATTPEQDEEILNTVKLLRETSE